MAHCPDTGLAMRLRDSFAAGIGIVFALEVILRSLARWARSSPSFENVQHLDSETEWKQHAVVGENKASLPNAQR